MSRALFAAFGPAKPSPKLGRVRPLLAVALAALVLPLHAHDEPMVLHDVVSLSASADAELDNDRLRATLVAQTEAETPAALADAINGTMGWALEALASWPDIERETRDYRTWPRRDASEARRLIGWEGSQSLVLESGDFAAMGEAMQTLQERLQVRDTTLYVGVEARREAADALVERALEAFERRAARIARTLGAEGYRILEVDVRTEEGGHDAPPMLRSRAMEADAMAVAEPAIAGGTSRLSAHAAGRVQLRRNDDTNGGTTK